MKELDRSPFAKIRGIMVALFALAFSLNVFADVTINGSVTDDTNEPLIGVTVKVKDKAIGVSTDIDGKFSLRVPDNSIIEFSYVGYRAKQLKASADMNVVLESDDKVLNEVVVIGYGAVKRKDLTTAVSSVSTDDLDRRPVTNAGQAIQGKAPGVTVISQSGQPGGDLKIQVRGVTSFNGSSEPLYVVDGVVVDNINFLSPGDITDMQILKDASSAAIYGSRAANGVILITTKSGKIGQPKISFTAQATISNVAKKIDVLNTEQYRELQKEIGIIDLPENLTDQTDWFDETYTTGIGQNYQLAVSNGNDNMKYYISLGYQKEKGILDISYFQRYNFRANVEGRIRPWLKAFANISYSDNSSNGGGTMGQVATRGGTVLSVINTPTYAPVWDPEHPNQYYNAFYGYNNLTNPRENMARAENNKDREDRIIASGSLLFTPLDGLSYKTTFTMDRRHGHSTTFLDPIKTAWGRNQKGEGGDYRNRNTVLSWDNVITYNHQFNQTHNLEVMVGSSWTDSNYSNSWISGSHYRNGDIQTLNAANKIGIGGAGSAGSTWGILSFFGRAAYNYDSRYYLTANVRADGSSKLHPDHRWAVFPSVSAAWRISAEKFMEPAAGWLDDLKLRAGWGKTGNQSGIGDYSYLLIYNTNLVDWTLPENSNAVPSISQGSMRVKDLTWEKTAQTNVGIDFSAFRNRLTVTLDLYYKKTTDMLMNVTLPNTGASASGTIKRNEGSMTNKGLEIGISSINFTGGDFEWTTDFNISFNKNKLTSLSTKKIYDTAGLGDYCNEKVVRNQPGKPLGSFYGYICDGVDPENGDLIYRDLNNDGRVSSSDRTFIGDPNPDFTYGLTNNLSWKGFNLSIFLQGSVGNDIYNASRMETEGMYNGANQTTVVLDRWQIPGQITDVPKAGYTMHASTYFIENGSYLRVKDITLSYNFKLPFMEKWGISKIQPYVTLTNLLTFTAYSGMDPEVHQNNWGNTAGGIDWGTYPHCRSYSFGVNIEF